MISFITDFFILLGAKNLHVSFLQELKLLQLLVLEY